MMMQYRFQVAAAGLKLFFEKSFPSITMKNRFLWRFVMFSCENKIL